MLDDGDSDDGGDDAAAHGSSLGTPLIDAESIAGGHNMAAPPAQQALAMGRGGGEGSIGGGGADRAAITDYAPITYNYSFFHLIFALASMYIAMLMTGWGAVEQEKDRLDVGWTSVWVKTGAEWVTGLLYTWTLLAPALLPDRDFGY
jgi:hypothetical protein